MKQKSSKSQVRWTEGKEDKLLQQICRKSKLKEGPRGKQHMGSCLRYTAGMETVVRLGTKKEQREEWGCMKWQQWRHSGRADQISCEKEKTKLKRSWKIWLENFFAHFDYRMRLQSTLEEILQSRTSGWKHSRMKFKHQNQCFMRRKPLVCTQSQILCFYHLAER